MYGIKIMRIHLIPPHSLLQAEMAAIALTQEKHLNGLLSYAYQKTESTQQIWWNGLINHVESTRNK
jgi:hypothetical protein